MKTVLLAGILAAALLVCGCQGGSESYSQDLSKEVKQPDAKGEDFGAFKPEHPLEGGHPGK